MFWAKGKGIWAAWTSSACLFSSSAVVTELLLPRRPRVQPQWHGGSFHSCRRQGLCKKGPSISFLCHDERARSIFSNLQKLDADWHLKFCFQHFFVAKFVASLCPICSGPGLTATIAGALTGSPLSSHRLQCSGGVPRAVAVAGWMTWDCRIMDSMDLASIRCAGSQFSAECSKGNKMSPSDYACQAWAL